MATNLAIDPDLLEIALKAGGLKTKKDTVNLALAEVCPEAQERGYPVAFRHGRI